MNGHMASTLANRGSQNVKLKELHEHSKLQAATNGATRTIRFVPATHLTFEDEKRMRSVDAPRHSTKRIKTAPAHSEAGFKTPAPRKTSVWTGLTGSKGLSNSGIMCYRNSVLQALLHIPTIVDWLLTRHKNCELQNRCVACHLRLLCETYWQHASRHFQLDKVVAGLQRRLFETQSFRRAGFDSVGQQDGPEFYCLLVAAVFETNPELKASLTPILGHSLAVQMTCPKCGTASRTDTKTNEDFIVTVKYRSALPLQQLLRQDTFGQSIVEGRRCEKCKQLSNTPRIERILGAPPVLVVQLCRFTQTRYGQFIKDDRHISIPEELDLSSCAQPKRRLRYVLRSVVQHTGRRTFGHYRTYGKAPSGGWDVMDDSTVSRASFEAAVGPRAPWTPYMLFYDKEEA